LDETSMVDVLLMRALVRAVPECSATIRVDASVNQDEICGCACADDCRS
jgi:hypothetical protein